MRRLATLAVLRKDEHMQEIAARTRWLAGMATLVALLLIGGLPTASGHHVQEATDPIVGVYMYLYNYTDRQASQLTAEQCAAGTHVYEPKNMRLETWVVFEEGAQPTEHWNANFQVKLPIAKNKTRHVFNAESVHANVPPHLGTLGASHVKFGPVPSDGQLPAKGEFKAWRTGRENIREMDIYTSGQAVVTYSLKGRESGNEFLVRCKFQLAE